ncbi:YCF48-related protein [Variovorax sp. YR216]|uniref:WD40/YVTN/BNR-like repeat-containing protein n=1 Tax=Variovorax sp. YR216 TaxID=1882828 RepID=UPI0008962CF1|nr:YCF48-related protein [Variovorax sp. YR216]SEB15962.1 Uncharacterized protein SAMN05444680_11097 [Variovorax sp. YR216]
MKGFASWWVLACGLVGAAHAAPVADALDRPALMVRAPARAVLLAATECGSRLVAVGERGIVVTSDDGGVQWRQSRVPVSVTLTAVQCPEPMVVYATGHGGVVLASSDGGATWSRRLEGRRAAQLALHDAQASGNAKAVQEAQRLVDDGADKPFLDLHFFDARHGLVVGAYGLAFSTEDGGQTWQPWMKRLPNPNGAHLYALRVRGSTLLVAGEQGLVLQSTDGGREFHRLEVPYQGSFFTAELPADQEIVLAGLRGNVWRSTDEGRSWTQLRTPAPVSVTTSAMSPKGRLLLGNQAGALLRVSGADVVPLEAPALPPLNALQPLRSGALLALTDQGPVAVPMPESRP